MFQVLRHLHAKQARQLAKLSWKVPNTGERFHLLESFQLRDYYGDLIGEIAESHHWSAHRVAATFEYRHVNAPGFLAPAGWVVNALKVAFLLRTADAAHIDGQRAPWFLFALRHPEGISQLHGKFRAKMGQPLRTSRGELRLSPGSPFDLHDRQAWWLTYDVACIIDPEVRDAQTLMRDTGRTAFAAVSVEHVGSPEAFATNVRTAGWEPVNVAPKIGDVPKVIANLGGAILYGDRPVLALRELLQNAADAVRALSMLGEIEPREGEIEIALARDRDLIWLHVTDTGIGMSRHVLTEVLLDFGHSLWSSESLRTELPGLASKGFKAIGRFGIGFFSVFMLGRKVVVTTRRFSRSSNDDGDQWLLEFSDGLEGRPTLRRPASNEALRRPGTRVSVALDHRTLKKPNRAAFNLRFDETDFRREVLFKMATLLWRSTEQSKSDDVRRVVAGFWPTLSDDFRHVVAGLCPTLDVTVRVKIAAEDSVTVVTPGDWQTLKPEHLLNRLYKGSLLKVPDTLIDLRDPSGVLLGRIGHAGSFHHAILTYAGLRSGTVPNLAGVVLGHNNLDLARNESQPVPSHEAWQHWAEAWIDST